MVKRLYIMVICGCDWVAGYALDMLRVVIFVLRNRCITFIVHTQMEILYNCKIGPFFPMSN